MILSGHIGRFIVRTLTKLTIFNKNYVVVGPFAGAYKIFRHKPKDELTKIQISPDNILSLKFDYYDSNGLLNQHTSQIHKHDFENKFLVINLWNNPKMETSFGQFVLNLTDETNEALAYLLGKNVFKEKFGSDYKYFLSVWLHPDILKAKSDNRNFAEGTLKYSLKSGKKEHRFTSKFSMTKEEAKNFYANASFWKAD
jgi:hypothetical protein